MRTTRHHTGDHRISIFIGMSVGAALAPFVLNHYLNGNWFLFATTGLLCIVAPAQSALIYYWRDNERMAASLTFATLLFGTLGYLSTLFILGAMGIYWAYLLVLINFYLLPLRRAVALTSLMTIGSLLLVYGDMPLAAFARCAVTLPLVAAFAFEFSRHVDRQCTELARLANIDQVTRAGNRRGFDTSIEKAAERQVRYGERISLILLDIDHFKLINDTRGHAVGDEILAALASRIQRRLRRTDLFFRYGGDEFIVLASHTNEARAMHLANKLRQEIRQAPLGSGIDVTISAGVAELAPDEEVHQWFHRVDQALYQAKRNGRNRVQLAPLTNAFDQYPMPAKIA